MLDINTLLPDLKALVTDLAEDLLTRSTADKKIDAGLRDAFKQIEKGGRTAQAFETWRDDYLDQVAVAWVLACVFVRFMEDNQLIEECWLADEGDRRKLAEGAHELFFRQHPHDSDREYFEHVFREVGKIPAAKELFAEGKTPLWAVGPSGDAAMKLLAFWREIDPEEGHLRRSFEVENGDTRFLGDLYEALSVRAQEKFALRQTPEFVEEFILSRTLHPAIEEFGFRNVKMIDPTCGSGHFLLGGFACLFREWCRTESNERNAAQKALDGIWGVDVNPFAVAIARFRLIVAAVYACGIKQLKQAPGWKVHLATGDSLLFGSRWNRSGEKISEQGWLGTDEESWAPEIYACEDQIAIEEVLGQQYDVVVGNPPYITVGDDALNAAYRKRYTTCHRLYSLAVPFTERFFNLCKPATLEHGAGYVGMITANSFMKRIFGKKFIQLFLPTVDLTHVIDTSVAYIPGHTTSTVILFGRNRLPVQSTVRTVLGIKGEEGVPPDPSNGVVWQSLVRQVDLASSVSAYCSSSDMPRETLHKHPWSIGGGGAAELAELLQEKRAWQLGDLVSEIGFGVVTREDDAYLVGPSVPNRYAIPKDHTKPIVSGDGVRDWSICNPTIGLFPYDSVALRPSCPPTLEQFLWPLKTQLSIRIAYGMTQLERGNTWYEFSMLFRERLRSPSLAFAEIATHTHFAFDQGSHVFTQSAPIIKLKSDSTIEQHFALLGILNSSVVCFWAKQVMPCKGLGGQGGGIKPEHWSRQYVHSGTLTKLCPIPAGHDSVAQLATTIHDLAMQAQKSEPSVIISQGGRLLPERLESARQSYEAIHRKMVFLQEELDWAVYTLFGLCEATCAELSACEDGICPEDRPVERLLLARIAQGEKSIFYEVHAYRGTGKRKQEPTQSVRTVIDNRLRIIASNADIRLIEQVDFKRRWQVEPWDKQVHTALREWMLDRLETSKYQGGSEGKIPELTTAARIADVASSDGEFMQVAAVYRGRPDFDVPALVAELIENESVPFLPVLRYKPSGRRKREVWERTWDLQREEDRLGQKVEQLRQQLQALQKELSGKPSDEVDKILNPLRREVQTKEQEWKEFGRSIAVPPKYTSADFQKSGYWRLRGKLDVPKERWISYPHCHTESDPTLVICWAGWNHLQQATALVAYYDARKREGWDAKRLTPLLAGLDQLLPWIHQWHPEIDKETGNTAGQDFQGVLEEDAHELGLTLEQIRAWKPPEKKMGKKKQKDEEDGESEEGN